MNLERTGRVRTTGNAAATLRLMSAFPPKADIKTKHGKLDLSHREAKRGSDGGCLCLLFAE